MKDKINDDKNLSTEVPKARDNHEASSDLMLKPVQQGELAKDIAKRVLSAEELIKRQDEETLTTEVTNTSNDHEASWQQLFILHNKVSFPQMLLPLSYLQRSLSDSTMELQDILLPVRKMQSKYKRLRNSPRITMQWLLHRT